MKPITRVAIIIAGLLLIAVLFVPLWSIELVAPQYPEGLELIINPNGLAGNVDIINGLNHYIGMKTLHVDDFPEFKILPWLIMFFAATFILAGIAANVKGLKALAIAFVLFGVVAMADFWQWEYAYGHDLNPEAAIKVPGMAYQPPLIGYKQLLNFAAYSMPDIGGWIFVGAGVILISCLFYEVRLKKLSMRRNTAMAIAMIIVSLISSCSSAPEPIRIGKDNCDNCTMTISDGRFGAIFYTTKGRTYKFDDIKCLKNFKAGNADIRGSIYLRDYCAPRRMTPIASTYLLQSEALHSPMGSNTAAFASHDSLKHYMQQLGGTLVDISSIQQ